MISQKCVSWTVGLYVMEEIKFPICKRIIFLPYDFSLFKIEVTLY